MNKTSCKYCKSSSVRVRENFARFAIFSLREHAIKCLWKTIVQIIYIFIAKVSPLEQIHLDKSRNENWLTVMHTFIAAKNLNASVVKGT